MGRIKSIVTEHGWKKAEEILKTIKHNRKIKSSCGCRNKDVNSTTKKGEIRCR